MAHSLVVHYALHRRMEISRPFPASSAALRRFHSDDYVSFLASVGAPASLSDFDPRAVRRFNVGEDCPVFEGLYQFCQASAGGSIGPPSSSTAATPTSPSTGPAASTTPRSARPPASATSTTSSSASSSSSSSTGSFNMQRVLYVDIDIHHGDGVEEAFYTTDRVMTVSFHKYGEFFPGTGHISDVGNNEGKYYAVNVPLSDGMDDISFGILFRSIIQKVMEVYQPDVVVLQCGADSLAGDRLGCFNLSVRGHADCLRYLRSFNVPMMVLGGGGYTIRNVARCWCYETAVAVGVEPDNKLPYNEYYEYFGPDYTLHIEPKNVENLNSAKDLENIRNMIFEHLSQIEHAPSVQFHPRPPDTEVPEEEEEDMERRPRRQLWSGESYDSDPEDGQNQRSVNDQVATNSDKEDEP
uniref:Histone deacetylase n=1 Tax=Ananas comosus var. bracteatus TaxID=296719 RepID=A0A6V7PVL6_ANACO|nr:unnamed protein product [Ananas comosus var. bracteatus]